MNTGPEDDQFAENFLDSAATPRVHPTARATGHMIYCRPSVHMIEKTRAWARALGFTFQDDPPCKQ
jgi:hypothetical protein